MFPPNLSSMGTMGARDLLFLTMSHNVSFVGKTWWVLMLALRLLLLLLAGSTLFSDEQERFVCNTAQPGCSTVCFDALAPVSALRLWLVHLVLLCLPHALFATYVVHRLLPPPAAAAAAAAAAGFDRERRAPRFYGAYLLVVLLRLLLEVAFAAGQLLLFGASVPRRFLCYEAPCASGVECYVSRPTEKTVMLNVMLAVASLSVLLSAADLASSAKAVVMWRRRRRRRRENLTEETTSKGEQSSMITTTTTAEDAKEEASAAAAVPNGAVQNGAAPHAKLEASRPPARACAPPAPTHFVLDGHLRPPPGRRPDGAPGPRTPSPRGVRQQPGGGAPQDRRAWV